MIYENIVRGVFLERPNRFIAHVLINGKLAVTHVKNTGRCAELLTPGAVVYLKHEDKAGRKTQYSLISVLKGNLLINMDSQIPNYVVEEGLLAGKIEGIDASNIKREIKYFDSRFDIYFKNDKKLAFMEVKGVTLESEGIAKFPDAPTKRGVKHISHLIKAHSEGYEAYIFLLVQMKGIKYFTPNFQTDPDFSHALNEASACGVTVLCYDSIVTENSIELGNKVKILLSGGCK